MLSYQMLLLSFFAIIDAQSSLPSTSVSKDPNTVLVIFGTRHGNRNPEQFLPGLIRDTWGLEGEMELTSIGKLQAYGLGQEIRRFIGNFTSNHYNSSQVSYYSSSANRCQMTLQTALAGIHTVDAASRWNEGQLANWSPIPYKIDNPMLRMYSVENCPNNDIAWEPIDKDTLPELQTLREQYRSELEYMSQMTGWNLTKNLGLAGDVADNLIQLDFYNQSLPEWIAEPKNGMNSTNLIETIYRFAEIHPNACAHYKPCRYLMSGYWLNHIIETLKKAESGKSHLRLVGYSSHTEITLSVMKAMGILAEHVTTAAGFVIEYKAIPAPAIRLLKHDPNPIEDHLIYKAELSDKLKMAQDSTGFITLDTFVDFAKPNSFSNWRDVCGTFDRSSTSKISTRVLLLIPLAFVILF